MKHLDAHRQIDREEANLKDTQRMKHFNRANNLNYGILYLIYFFSHIGIKDIDLYPTFIDPQRSKYDSATPEEYYTSALRSCMIATALLLSCSFIEAVNIKKVFKVICVFVGMLKLLWICVWESYNCKNELITRLNCSDMLVI
jgi:hypothetical protein